jgi:hypothetical protein
MNSITDKLARSWRLFTTSVIVIRSHPKLLVFPFVTGLLTTLIALFFLAPVVLVFLAPQWLQGGLFHFFAGPTGFVHVRHGTAFAHVQPLGGFLLAGIYLLNMFLATLSSVAFNSEILEALSGRPVSIQHGLEVALQRWKTVLLWSLLAGTVGLLIRALEERMNFLGRLITGMIGLAWSVASIFAIPVLIREPSLSNPFDVLSKSAKTIQASWGEMLTGYLGMQGTNLLVLWGSILYWVGNGALAFAISKPWLLLVALGPWLLFLVLYAYVASIASRVYLCALYLYASEGSVPGPFDAPMMTMAFKPRKN